MNNFGFFQTRTVAPRIGGLGSEMLNLNRLVVILKVMMVMVVLMLVVSILMSLSLNQSVHHVANEADKADPSKDGGPQPGS